MPTLDQNRPFSDEMAEAMMSALERNCREFGIPLSDLTTDRQGIVHVIGPELGLTQPGMTIACGDSHTSTHGAFGAVAFGIGTSQVRDVLASQCLAIDPLKVRRIRVEGALGRGVYAKDVILEIIARLGVQGGVGYAYEYAGETVRRMSMDERMTMCNMSIEGGARVGYVNPDQTTFDYLEGRPFVPTGEALAAARAWWASMASDPDAVYDDEVAIAADEIEPRVTWGINPGQSVGVSGRLPQAASDGVSEALTFMGFEPGAPIQGTRIDVAFVGSCTNLASVRPERGGRDRPRADGGPSRQGTGRTGLEGRESGGRGRGARRCVSRGRVRMARRRLLDVPGHEPRPAPGTRGLRVLVKSELQGAARQPHRSHPAHESGDGGRRRPRRRGCRRANPDPRGGFGVTRIDVVEGRGIPLRGGNIDTDRIIPARFLKAITFEGLGEHVFEDDRRADPDHPFSDPKYQEASVLLVNENFGSGSSREHAPQALKRWGIAACIGESFSEIFQGNAVSIGLVCATADPTAIDQAMQQVERHPDATLRVSVKELTLTVGDRTVAISMPAPVQHALVNGHWDATGLLLDQFDDVRQVAGRLPYVSGFAAPTP